MDDNEISHLQSLGFSLIPVKNRDKVADIKWAKYQNERATNDQINAWRTNGYANFAVVTGKISGILVVDVDNLAAFEVVSAKGIPPNTPCVSTGKGVHLYFAYPDSIEKELGKVKSGVNIGGIQGLDLRCDGGYVLAPGSIHPSGRVYKWHVEPPKGAASMFPPIPDWLRKVITSRDEKIGGPTNKGVNSATGEIKEGGRNVQMHRIASALRARGRSRREILERIKSENETRCNPPLDESELVTIADSVSRYAQEIGDYELNEMGNAQRLIDLYSDQIRFSIEHGKWLIWDDCRWRVDHAENIIQYAIRVSASLHDEAERVTDEKMKKRLKAFANATGNFQKLKSMIAIAKTQEGVSIHGEGLDRNKWILNCPNGMVDLQTGDVLEHDRSEFCTKVTGTEYHPEAECPRWLQFLDEITDGNEELQLYHQRIIGYSLTGDTSEHVWFLLLGNGRNGKSTYLNALQSMLGDYSSNIRPEALLMQGMDRVPNDLAALKGARFTAASETPASRKLNESLIKQLTGGDAVQARFLFREFFEFTPQCKLFLATNYRPNIQGTDVGIWRRTHEVPFPVSIPESQCDPNLANKLQEELPGILAWAVRGCLEWQKKRLAPPSAVQNARREYYEEMDVLGQFIKEWCEVDEFPDKSDIKTPVKDLYRAFTHWAMLNSEDLLTNKAFSMKLNQRGIPACRMSDSGRGRRGIKLTYEEVVDIKGKQEWRQPVR